MSKYDWKTIPQSKQLPTLSFVSRDPALFTTDMPTFLPSNPPTSLPSNIPTTATNIPTFLPSNIPTTASPAFNPIVGNINGTEDSSNSTENFLCMNIYI